MKLPSFLLEDQGQDLVEYTLLLAFVTLAAGGVFLAAGGNVRQVWQRAGMTMSSAATITATAAPDPGVTPSIPRGDDDGHDDGHDPE